MPIRIKTFLVFDGQDTTSEQEIYVTNVVKDTVAYMSSLLSVIREPSTLLPSLCYAGVAMSRLFGTNGVLPNTASQYTSEVQQFCEVSQCFFFQIFFQNM